MKRTLVFALIGIAALAALATFAAAAAPSVAKADPKPDVVTVWNRTMVDALETAKTPPPPAMRIGALVQSSVFDGLNGIVRRYTPIHVEPAAPPGASRKAAVVGAAYEVLVAVFPAQKPTFDAQAGCLAGTDRRREQRPVSSARPPLGEASRRRDPGLASRRRHLGRPSALRAGRAARGWAPTPPTFAPTPAFREFANMTPWAMTSPVAVPAARAPASDESALHAGRQRVKAIGRDTSAIRTPSQDGDRPVLGG